MERRLYVHEVVDIVGRGAAPYMAHVVAFDPGAVADRGLDLAGTWEVVGTTGRWPQVVNLWDVVDGWDGWTRLTRRTNLAKASNAELAGWWDEALESRTGGLDRLLVSAPGAPDPMAMARSGRRGEVAVHEITRVQPGAGPAYLSALIERWAPAAAEVGVHLVGAFEVLMTDVEVVTVWVASLDAHTAMLRAGVDGPAVLPGFAESRRQWCTAWREELMVPGPGSPFHPATPA
jgi:hypothetical protein